MSRDLTSGVSSAVQAASLPLLVLVELDFESGTSRYSTAPFNLTWNGQTWYGIGTLGSIDATEETGTVEAKGISMQISGIDPAKIAIALGDHYQGRSCKVYAAPLDSNHQVIADPKLIFDGRMDTMEVQLGQTATIVVTAESRLADLERPRVRRFNDADQQNKYPGDLFFQFVDQMVEVQINWGVNGPATQLNGWIGGMIRTGLFG